MRARLTRAMEALMPSVNSVNDSYASSCEPSVRFNVLVRELLRTVGTVERTKQYVDESD